MVFQGREAWTSGALHAVAKPCLKTTPCFNKFSSLHSETLKEYLGKIKRTTPCFHAMVFDTNVLSAYRTRTVSAAYGKR